jgi:hypothetical protein
MSRGPGRWQRLILDAVDEHRYVTLRQLVVAELRVWGSPPPVPRAAEVAARRAARQLAEADRILLSAQSVCRRCLYPQARGAYWCNNPQCGGKYGDLTYLETVRATSGPRVSVAFRRNAWQHIDASWRHAEAAP